MPQNRWKEYLFVDGYNIINSWKELKQIADVDLEEARNKLIDIMIEYHHSTGIEVVVVFDAHLVKKNIGTEYEQDGIKVVYTKEFETADNYIERSLDELGRVKRIRVATSDWLEQQIVLSRGGTRISARELEMEVRGIRKLIDRNKDIMNEKNEINLGSLDDETLKRLKSWKEGEDK